MRSLDTAHVPEFEKGQCALAGVTKREFDIPPPPKSGAHVHRCADALRGGAPAANGAADPVVCLIEALRAFDEVEHRVLDADARRSKDRMPGPRDRP
jgi:hypothetical protein